MCRRCQEGGVCYSTTKFGGSCWNTCLAIRCLFGRPTRTCSVQDLPDAYILLIAPCFRREELQNIQALEACQYQKAGTNQDLRDQASFRALLKIPTTALEILFRPSKPCFMTIRPTYDVRFYGTSRIQMASRLLI